MRLGLCLSCGCGCKIVGGLVAVAVVAAAVARLVYS